MRDVKTGPRMVLILCLFMSNAVEMGDGKRKEAKIQCEYQVGSLCQVTEQPN